ncbi:MAG: hypothetical protein IPH45_15835 [Bacteroidales bacterium]|nr:hypothetical protein [Bacteroidales bacterium]
MRKILLLAFAFLSLVFMGSEPIYYEYTPVFITRSDMEQAIKYESSAPVKNPGKIYIKDNYLFINEKYKGFHVFDNTDPSNPVNKGFVRIDGCLDIAMKGSIMYVDNSVDLVAIQVDTENSTLSVKGRVRNALPEPSSPDGFWTARSFEKYRPKNGIIVRWEKSS